MWLYQGNKSVQAHQYWCNFQRTPPGGWSRSKARKTSVGAHGWDELKSVQAHCHWCNLQCTSPNGQGLEVVDRVKWGKPALGSTMVLMWLLCALCREAIAKWTKPQHWGVCTVGIPFLKHGHTGNGIDVTCCALFRVVGEQRLELEQREKNQHNMVGMSF